AHLADRFRPRRTARRGAALDAREPRAPAALAAQARCRPPARVGGGVAGAAARPRQGPRMSRAIPLALDPGPLDRLRRPLRDLRLSLIETCNFRCPYCMPAERFPDVEAGDSSARLDFDEIERLVRAF